MLEINGLTQVTDAASPEDMLKAYGELIEFYKQLKAENDPRLPYIERVGIPSVHKALEDFGGKKLLRKALKKYPLP
jgi:hypothetical protein